MKLMTAEELQSHFEFLKSRSIPAIKSFLKSRGVRPVKRGEKRVKGFGSAPFVYECKQVEKAWIEKPLGKSRRFTSKGSGVRKYHKQGENENDYELGQRQPFRTDECVNFYECLDNAAKKNKKMKCKSCPRYQRRKND